MPTDGGRANSRSQYTKIYSRFGKSSREYFVKETKKCLRNIEAAAEQEKIPTKIGTMQNILEEILTKHQVSLDFAQDWWRRFEEILEDLSQRAKREVFLEGVIIKLDKLRNDLLLHYLEGFQMVPLKVARPNSSREELFPTLGHSFDMALSISAEGLTEKAKNLKDFLSQTSRIHEQVYFKFDSLKKAKGKVKTFRKY